MSEFLSIEETAKQLSVSEVLVRQWIRRGLARAVRRGGEYTLRLSEVQRLRAESANLPPLTSPAASESQEIPSPEAAVPRKPKVLPPRSQDPDSVAGEKDRRRRMGRRNSDFTLEILHMEIKNAVGAALEPLLPRLDEIQRKLLLPLQSQDQDYVQPLEERIRELQSQHQHLELAREDFRQRLEESESERQRLEQQTLLIQQQQAQQDDGTQQLLQRLSQEVQNERQLRLELQQQLEQLRAQPKDDAAVQRLSQEVYVERQLRLAAQEQLEHLRAQPRDDGSAQRLSLELDQERHLRLEMQQQLEQLRAQPRDDGSAQRLSLELEQERRLRLEMQQQLEHLRAQPRDDGAVQRLSQEVQQERQLRLEIQQQLEHLRAQPKDDGTLHRLSQEVYQERLLRLEAQEHLERSRAEIAELQSASLTVDAERARWSLESRSLQGEIDRLTSMQQEWAGQRQELEQSQARLQALEKSGGEADARMEEKDQELRRLREQINSLTYRLQMAGTGSAGPTTEDSRRLMEKLADAEAEMDEKNQLITQNYAEISDLRGKLDAMQRNHYELQQRFERLNSEWGQMAAQVAAKQMSDHQQQQAPAPGSERPKGWGGLFGRRGDP